MEYISADSVANIVLFVVPGYFAAQTYATLYSKGDKDFSRILLESVVLSLPIVSIYNFWWHIFTNTPLTVTKASYLLPLLVLAIGAGWIAAHLRRQRWAKQLTKRLRFPMPEEDFLKAQLGKLGKYEMVTVTLKNGVIFSGRPISGSPFRPGMIRQYYFDDVAWFNADTGSWESRPGSVIVTLDEVLFIETNAQLAAD